MNKQTLQTSTPEPTSVQLAAGLLIMAGFLSLGNACSAPPSVGSNTDDESAVAGLGTVHVASSGSGASCSGAPQTRNDFVFGSYDNPEYNYVPAATYEGEINAALENWGYAPIHLFVGNENGFTSGLAATLDPVACTALTTELTNFILYPLAPPPKSTQTYEDLDLITHSNGIVTAACAIQNTLAALASSLTTRTACLASTGLYPPEIAINVTTLQTGGNAATVTSVQQIMETAEPGGQPVTYKTACGCVTVAVYWNINWNVADFVSTQSTTVGEKVMVPGLISLLEAGWGGYLGGETVGLYRYPFGPGFDSVNALQSFAAGNGD
jgi:hypothetical protein